MKVVALHREDRAVNWVSMNYFTHALPFLDGDPYFLAGTAVPDWMSVADRQVRVRAKLAAPLREQSPNAQTRCVAAGACSICKMMIGFTGRGGSPR